MARISDGACRTGATLMPTAMCPCGVTIGGDGSSPVGVTTFEKPSSNMLTRPKNLSWRHLTPSLANAVVTDAPNAVPPETAH